MMEIQSESIQKYIDYFMEMVVEYTPKVLLAIITLWVGLKLIKLLGKLIDSIFEKKEIDETLRPFLKSIIDALLKIMLFLSVVSMVGIETTSFIAVLGAMGLAVGLSLQGTLANFAGGVLILIFKPYKVGDFIDAQGYQGTVNKIQIFNTILLTPQNRKVIIPNAGLSNGALTNYSAMEKVRIDFTFGVSYSADIKQTKQLLEKIIQEDSRILKEPLPSIVLGELADSSVNFYVRPWVKSADYWNVYFQTMEKVKTEFDAAGIEIPYPQTDVHLHSVK